MCEKNPSEFSERDPEHGHKFYDAFQHLLLTQEQHQLQQQQHQQQHPQQLQHQPQHQQQLHYAQQQNTSTISDVALSHLGIHSMS